MYLIKKKERARMVLTVLEEWIRLVINKASLRTQSFTGLRFNAVYNEQRHGKYCKTTTHHFHFLCLATKGILIYPCLSVPPSVRSSVCPSGYRYMICLAISSYSYGATALIFCMMFIHIMEVDLFLFIISYGKAGASFVSYKHTSFLKNHP